MTETYDATLNGDIVLPVARIDDAFVKAIAQYEYPYRDGAHLKDMGQRARVISVRCCFMNEEYENHKAVLAYLERNADRTEHELVHPQYGIIQGQIEAVNVGHSELDQHAEVTITFIEELGGTIDLERAIVPDLATEAAFAAGQAELETEIYTDMIEELGAEARTLAGTVFDWAAPLLPQIQNATARAREWVRTADTYIAKLATYANGVTNPANSILGLMEAPANICGIVARKAAQAMERYATLLTGATDYPDRFAASFALNITEVVNGATSRFQKPTRIAAAQRVGVELGTIFKHDADTEAWQRKVGAVAAWTPLGQRATTTDTAEAPMTVDAMERQLADARTIIQAAVSEARATQSLKKMAQTLTEHVLNVKANRPKLTTVTIDNPLPAHLICLIYGRPYGEADVFLAVNSGRVRNPNMVQGEVQIYGG